MVLYYLLRNYRSRGGATAAGAVALHAVAPKSVEKNIVKISTEPINCFFILGVSFRGVCGWKIPSHSFTWVSPKNQTGGDRNQIHGRSCYHRTSSWKCRLKKRSGTRYFGTGADCISIIVSKVDKIPAARPSSLVLIHFVLARDNRQVNRGWYTVIW